MHNAGRKVTMPYCSGMVGSVRQIALQPANATAACWSLHEVAERGDTTYRLSLVKGVNRETEVLRDSMRIVSFACAPDHDLICLGSYCVRLLKIQKGREALTLFQRETAVEYVTFVGGGQQIAVIRYDDPWLEIWDVATGLPTVAAADLPGRVTCFAASGDLMVVGFESGELLRLRLRGPRTYDHIH